MMGLTGSGPTEPGHACLDRERGQIRVLPAEQGVSLSHPSRSMRHDGMETGPDRSSMQLEETTISFNSSRAVSGSQRNGQVDVGGIGGD